MSTLKDLRNIRIGKLDNLKALEVDPFPAESLKDVEIGSVLAGFSDFEGKEVTTAGRIIAIRAHGKLTFFDVKDSTGKIQFYIK